jgi:uncharacterized protein with PIN domain
VRIAKLGKVANPIVQYTGKCLQCEAELIAEPNEVNCISRFPDGEQGDVLCPICGSVVIVVFHYEPMEWKRASKARKNTQPKNQVRR